MVKLTLCDYPAANDPGRPLSAPSKPEQEEVFLRVTLTIATA